MDNNIVIFGYNMSIKTIVLICIITLFLFIMFQGEQFTENKKCSDIKSGDCTSELCAELSFCKPQKQENGKKCNCVEDKEED
jgi:hypothetical protein